MLFGELSVQSDQRSGETAEDIEELRITV